MTYIEQISVIINKFKSSIHKEIIESKELYSLLKKWKKNGFISIEEKKIVKEQIYDILKTIPALAILVFPFGTLMLYILIKQFHINILPSAFLEENDDKN